MGQCMGKTKAGQQCKREAAEGSDYCSIHEPEQEVVGDDSGKRELDLPTMILGIAAAAIAFWIIQRPPGWLPRPPKPW